VVDDDHASWGAQERPGDRGIQVTEEVRLRHHQRGSRLGRERPGGGLEAAPREHGSAKAVGVREGEADPGVAALAFQRAIGAERKIARLRWLRDRWAKRLLAESDRVQVLTPLDSPYAGAICLFGVKGIDTVKLNGWLYENARIVSTAIVHPEFSGIRVTPNVYTTPDEIDTFTDQVLLAIKKGIA
jgi:selenocysteine lyase/cysteine desulfurase